MTATSRRLHHVGTLTPVSNMTATTLRLAEEIDAAVDKYGLGNNHRMFTGIKFFEGELRLIDCRLLALRGAAEGRKAVNSCWCHRPVASALFASPLRIDHFVITNHIGRLKQGLEI